MCSRFLLAAVFAAFVLHFAKGQCVYTSTECQCSQQPAGNPCLSYLSGADATLQCEVYECSSGYVCDCGGTEMCQVSDCTATRDVYRPLDSTPLVVGNPVSCELATEVTCVSPGGASVSVSPSPSPIAGPSSSSSPGVSASSSPAASASSSPGASASSSPAASASSSPSATPSVTPSTSPPGEVALGGACDLSTTCVTGAACGCLGTCERIVTIEATGLGADSLELFICDTSFGTATDQFRSQGTWSYTGVCGDLYMEVTNHNGGHTGVVAAVKESGGAWLSTKLPGGGDLQGITAYNPPLGFMSDPTYDFNAWYPVLEQTSFAPTDSYWTGFAATYTADFWTHEDGHLGSANDITFLPAWYKIELPFC